MPGGPTSAVSKKFFPPPGKSPPGRRKALLDVSVSAPPKYLVGRIGPKNVPLGCRLLLEMTGVHGKPLLAVTIVLISQPPSARPTKSLRSRKMGSSQRTDAVK